MGWTQRAALAIIVCSTLFRGALASATEPEESVPGGEIENQGHEDAVAASPAPAAASRDLSPSSALGDLYVEFGRGVQLLSEDGDFSLTLRGRLQTRATSLYRSGEEGDDAWSHGFAVRRARLVFLGDLPSRQLAFYIQLGLSGGDLESDAQVPLRDGVISWTPHRDIGVRLGQQKVGFSRERIISSSALQLADRSAVNAEFSLDRDVGVQLFSNDLFGLGGRLHYMLGVFGGDGRNRAASDPGLLVASRLQVQPLGAFPDHMVEADLSRSRRMRLSLGVAGGYHGSASRQRATHGSFYDDDLRRRAVHGAADLFAKWNGWSLQTEWIVREMWADQVSSEEEEGEEASPALRNGLGGFVQVGYVFPTYWELAGRWSMIEPRETSSGLVALQELSAALGHYFQLHELKVQGDYTLRFVGGGFNEEPEHEIRLQMQVFF